MTARRKTRLVDCNPRWGSDSGECDCWITFDCPEAHEGEALLCAMHVELVDGVFSFAGDSR